VVRRFGAFNVMRFEKFYIFQDDEGSPEGEARRPTGARRVTRAAADRSEDEPLEKAESTFSQRLLDRSMNIGPSE